MGWELRPVPRQTEASFAVALGKINGSNSEAPRYPNQQVGTTPFSFKDCSTL